MRCALETLANVISPGCVHPPQFSLGVGVEQPVTGAVAQCENGPA
ncbi:MAG: hypothetical protein ACRDP1_06145 [Nocardioidaceae bacterium]